MATDIASPSNNTEIFQELDRYPWDKDVEFQVCPDLISAMIFLSVPIH
jgi:hypothetical protein